MSTERDAVIIDDILHSKSSLLAATECHRVFPQAIEELIKRRLAKFNAYCAKNDLSELKWQAADLALSPIYAAPLFCTTGNFLAPHNIGILAEAQKSGFRNVTYGIYWADKDGNKDLNLGQSLYEMLTDKFGTGKRQYEWIWVVNRQQWADWTSPDMLTALLEDNLTGYEKFFIELYSAVKKFFISRKS